MTSSILKPVTDYSPNALVFLKRSWLVLLPLMAYRQATAKIGVLGPVE
jgi:hypothetical protein